MTYVVVRTFYLVRGFIMVIDNGGDGSKGTLLGKNDTNKHLNHKLDLTLEIVGTIVDIQSLCIFVEKNQKVVTSKFHAHK